MNKRFPFLRDILFIGLLVLLSAPATGSVYAAYLTTSSNPAGYQLSLPRSPLSSSLLMAQAIHAGKIHPSASYSAPRNARPHLTCSPTPCVLPNVQASEGGQPVNEDPIATNPTNNLNLLTGSNDYNCASLQGFYASSDGGTTWNHTCMNTLSGASGDGDPGVGFDSTGAAYIIGIDAGTSDGYDVVFEKSTDGGTTWNAPAAAVKPLFSGGLTDKPWLQVDDNSSSPRVNSLYVSVTQFNSSETQTEISVSHSTDGGSTWTTVAVDTLQPSGTIDQFSDVTTDKAGNVYVTWMRCTANGPSGDCGGTLASFYLSKSSDGGNTWSTPLLMSQANLAPDTCGGYYGCVPNTNERVSDIPAIGVDNSGGSYNGNLYTVFYNWGASCQQTQQMQVEVTTSADGGSSWSTPVRVAPGATNDEFFPWLTVSSDGQVGVSWLDRRNDPSNLSYEAFAAVSTDGGASFGTNVQIATQPSNPDNDGFGGYFMGDYTGNYWSADTLYASWMDSRNGTNTQDEVGGADFGPSGSHGGDLSARVPLVVPGQANNMTYHCGPVMAGTMIVYTIFWNPTKSKGKFATNYSTLINQYYNDVAPPGKPSTLFQIMQQYDSAGTGKCNNNPVNCPTNSILGGTWLDKTKAYPAKIGINEVSTEIARAFTKNPSWPKGGSSVLFVVYTNNKGVPDLNPFKSYTKGGLGEGSDCAWHTNLANNNPPGIFAYVPYPPTRKGCVLPVPTPNANNNMCLTKLGGIASTICDSAINSSAHEQFEAATDPIVNPNPATGWYNTNLEGEIADQCNFQFGKQNKDGSNQNWNGHPYIIQEMWDNTKSACSLG